MSCSAAVMHARSKKAHELNASISSLSHELRNPISETIELELLRARADANLELAKLLRCIPAADSERWALNGLDLTQLATLALKDAQRGSQISPPSDGGFKLRMGQAQLLLEQYAAARESFSAALKIDSRDIAAQAGIVAVDSALAEVQQQGHDPSTQTDFETISSSITTNSSKRAKTTQLTVDSSITETLECPLCMRLLWEPVATPCAHIFCRTCFARSCDHGNKCPSCRTVLHVGRSVPVLSQLRSFLKAAYPVEYAERDAEERSSAATNNSSEPSLPLFVMASMLPGERMRLHIFEPRYRLLVRRAMEGSRRLGMVALGERGTIARFATECEITECQPLADGRFYLELRATRRFKVGRQEELDGYRVAVPQFVEDDPVPNGTPEADELRAVMQEVETHADDWVQQLRVIGASRLGGRVAELLERAGPKPLPDVQGRPEKLGFWVACVLPLPGEKQQELLETTSSLARLRMLREEQSRFNNSEGCAIG